MTMTRQNRDPYLVLGVSPTATQAEITHAYRIRLRAHHPDTRHTPASHTADDELRQVLAAYALLRDPARRADYDDATSHTPTPPQHRLGPTPVKDRRIRVPVTYRPTNPAAPDIASPLLRAGPVRRHR